MAKITVDELAKTIEDTLREYIDVTEEAAQKGTVTTAQEAVEELRGARPNPEKSWKEYNSGWTYRKTKNSKGVSGVVVHNATHYQLTHLLEHGHALVDGGHSRPFPHIAPVAERAENNLLNNIKANIQ